MLFFILGCWISDVDEDSPEADTGVHQDDSESQHSEPQDSEPTDTGCEEPLSWWGDQDKDGFGAGQVQLACLQPPDTSDRDGDCDDDDPNTFPGSAERDSAEYCMTDADGDGHGSSTPAEGVIAGTDCDDGDASVTTECRWRDVAAADGSSCGVRGDGRLICWGSVGDWLDLEGPFVQVEGDHYNFCARREEGSVTCFGDPYGYFLYDDLPGETMQHIETNTSFACGLTTTGDIVCWSKAPETSAFSGKTWKDVAVGGSHVCGLRDDGAVVCAGACAMTECESKAGPYDDIEAGYRYTCGVRAGKVSCWGDTDHATAALAGMEGIVGFEIEDQNGCVINGDGELACAGLNAPWGGLPEQPVSNVAVTASHACAVAVSGEPICWGSGAGAVVPD